MASPLKAGPGWNTTRRYLALTVLDPEGARFGKVNLRGARRKPRTITGYNMSKTMPETDVDDGFEDEEIGPNIVRIGKKPTMNYVVACVTLFNTGVPEVMVRARGQSINKAVETVEMLRRAFFKNVKIHTVDIGTEEVQRDDGSMASLSTIEITLGN
jgi:archaea-specific DNA-binding protein